MMMISPPVSFDNIAVVTNKCEDARILLTPATWHVSFLRAPSRVNRFTVRWPSVLLEHAAGGGSGKAEAKAVAVVATGGLQVAWGAAASVR